MEQISPVSPAPATALLPEDPAPAPDSSPLLILAREIRLLDLNSLTPLETLNRVKGWQELLADIPDTAGTLPFKRSPRKDKVPACLEGPGLFDS
jgi:hypothetical protein